MFLNEQSVVESLDMLALALGLDESSRWFFLTTCVLTR